MLRRVPLKRTGAIQRKRAVARRNEGRVKHARIKRQARFPDGKEQAYWNALERRCNVCGSAVDTVIHHILARLPQKIRQRDHRFVAVLCAQHHNMSDCSVHMLGSEAAFEEATGVDLVDIAVRNWGAFLA